MTFEVGFYDITYYYSTFNIYGGLITKFGQHLFHKGPRW